MDISSFEPRWFRRILLIWFAILMYFVAYPICLLVAGVQYKWNGWSWSGLWEEFLDEESNIRRNLLEIWRQ